MAAPAATDPSDPDSPRSGPISPDDEAQMAFATSQAGAAQRSQAQAAFDTLRIRRAFISGVLSAKGQAGQQRAFRESALGQNLEGAPPAQQ